jgi:hypothetical protein
MLVKFARAKWTICRRQRRAKALGGSLPARGGHTRSAEQKSGGSEGQGVADFGLGIGGSAATRPKNIAEHKGRTIGACYAHFETIGACILAPHQPESLSLIYAPKLRLRAHESRIQLQ